MYILKILENFEKILQAFANNVTETWEKFLRIVNLEKI